jgi:ketosteroid isomerase-like protein
MTRSIVPPSVWLRGERNRGRRGVKAGVRTGCTDRAPVTIVTAAWRTTGDDHAVYSDAASRDDRLQWLVDRARISDLLVAYAWLVDTGDFDGLAALFADDGALHLPFATLPTSEIAAGSRIALGSYASTHHISANHAIEISGDVASSRSYFQAVHVPTTDEPDRHADIGGRYDNTYRRVNDQWRFVAVRVTFVWTLGSGFPSAERSA